MPRLFTGIELPEDVVGRLSMLRAGLSGAYMLGQSGQLSHHFALCR